MTPNRVEVGEVLALINAAREAAGWQAIGDLPKGRRGPDRVHSPALLIAA